MGVSRPLISQWENGEKLPEPERAVRLADLLRADRTEFLILSLLQRGACRKDKSKDCTMLYETASQLKKQLRRDQPAAQKRGLATHLSLLDFPGAFSPITVIVGDKREEKPKNAGDLYVFSASPVDDRWLLSLGLPRDTEKISDKVLMTADKEWLEGFFGERHLLIIGSPASNLFARKYNNCFLFRFAIGREAEEKWEQKEKAMKDLRTPAEMDNFRDKSQPDLKHTMRLFKPPGFVNFAYDNLRLGIDPAESRDFAVVSLGRNPFAGPDAPYFAILAAGVHHPGTAHAVKFLSTTDASDRFKEHPFGGVIEVQVPADDYPRHQIAWHTKIGASRADWHKVGNSALEYTPDSLRNNLDNWKKREIVTDVKLGEDEIDQHIKLIEHLARARRYA
jgi:transcriptional regulator with XRE-family HTH domain